MKSKVLITGTSERFISLRMKEAFKEAEKSPCLKKKVGAVLLDESGKIVGRGYGGADRPCLKCVRKIYDWQQDGCWSIHSEIRAIFDRFKDKGFTENLAGHTMIVTHGPCDQCLKYMAHFGIVNVVYSKPYHNDYNKWSGIIHVVKLLDEGNLILENSIE